MALYNIKKAISKSHIFLYGLSGKIIHGISFSFSLSSSSVSVSHIFSLLNNFLCSFSSFSTLLLSSSNSSSSSSSVSSPPLLLSVFLSSSSSLLLAFSFTLSFFLFELVLDLEFSSLLLLELFDSELLSESLLSLLFEFELLSSDFEPDFEPDFSDLELDSSSLFLDLVRTVSPFFVWVLFDFFIEDELKLELFISDALLDFDFDFEILEFLECFELFFFSSDLTELDFFWELLLFLSLIKED